MAFGALIFLIAAIEALSTSGTDIRNTAESEWAEMSISDQQQWGSLEEFEEKISSNLNTIGVVSILSTLTCVIIICV